MSCFEVLSSRSVSGLEGGFSRTIPLRSGNRPTADAVQCFQLIPNKKRKKEMKHRKNSWFAAAVTGLFAAGGLLLSQGCCCGQQQLCTGTGNDLPSSQTPDSAGTPSLSIAQNAWVLDLSSLQGAEKGWAKPEKTIDFQIFPKDQRVAGCAGVNRYFGSAVIDGKTIRLGPLGATMMAGPGLEYAENACFCRCLENRREDSFPGKRRENGC